MVCRLAVQTVRLLVVLMVEQQALMMVVLSVVLLADRKVDLLAVQMAVL